MGECGLDGGGGIVEEEEEDLDEDEGCHEDCQESTTTVWEPFCWFCHS